VGGGGIEVTSSEVGQVGGHKQHFVFSPKLLDAQGCVGEGIVMTQEPIPSLPLFSFLSRVLTPSFQHIPVKLLIYCLSWSNKLPVH